MVRSKEIELIHIQPGRPMQNGYIESFNGRLRDECLNASWFCESGRRQSEDRKLAQQVITDRPHSSLITEPHKSSRKFTQELTSRMAALSHRDCPSQSVDRTPVLAGKGPPAPRPEGRALADSAPPCSDDIMTGGLAGWLQQLLVNMKTSGFPNYDWWRKSEQVTWCQTRWNRGW